MRRKLALLFIALAPLSSAACVSEKEKPKAVAASAASFELDALPADAQQIGVNFDNKITLLGYKTATKGSVKAGQKVTYTLYWQVNQPLSSKGWSVFTHVLDGKKKRLLNIDRVGPLREANLTPNDWKAGKIYADEQSFSVPKGESDKLQVSVGIWKGEERLPITAGPQLGDNRALAFSLPVKSSAPPNVAVPNLRADRLAAGTVLKMDGKLDEEAWKSAASTGSFIDVKSGKPATDSAIQGSARLLWDKDALYVGFDVQDKDVVGGFAKTESDPHLWTKDTVEIMIDPEGNGDNKDYYEIQVNPQNLVFDSQFDDYNMPKGGENGPFGHQDWSAKLTSGVAVDGTLDKAGDQDKGYTVEIKIPWASFSKAKKAPPELGQEWRINLYAMQNNGGVAWSPILGQGNFHKAARFGRVLFAEKGWQAPTVPVAPSAPTTSVNALSPAPGNFVKAPPGVPAAVPKAMATPPGAKPAPVTPAANPGAAAPAPQK